MTYTNDYIVVYDGTTAYVIPADELQQEIDENEVEVLGEFVDFDDACSFEEKANAEISNNGRN